MRPMSYVSHSGSGWCPRCRTECVLLDDDEKYGPDPYDYIDDEQDADE